MSYRFTDRRVVRSGLFIFAVFNHFSLSLSKSMNVCINDFLFKIYLNLNRVVRKSSLGEKKVRYSVIACPQQELHSDLTKFHYHLLLI